MGAKCLLIHNLSHPPVTCWSRLKTARGGQKTTDATCCMNAHLVYCARMQHCTKAFFCAVLQEIDSEVSGLGGVLGYPRRPRTARTQPHDFPSSPFYLHSTSSGISRCANHTAIQSDPFSSQKHVCPPPYLMGLLICNIDSNSCLKWVLQVVAEHSDVGQ